MEEIPDIQVEFDDSYNPMLVSPNCPYGLQFYKTKESMADVETYKKFIDNCIARFRHCKMYKQYKDYLYNDVGLDHCQVFPNISKDDASLEMHHNFLTIFDITLLITEHILNTIGYVSTFDVVQLLKEEHKANNIPIVMLCLLAHEVYHHEQELVLPAQMCFGDWATLISKYNRGITGNIAKKIINFINVSVNNDSITDSKMIYELLEFENNVKGWEKYNEYGDSLRIGGIAYSGDYPGIGYSDI